MLLHYLAKRINAKVASFHSHVARLEPVAATISSVLLLRGSSRKAINFRTEGPLNNDWKNIAAGNTTALMAAVYCIFIIRVRLWTCGWPVIDNRTPVDANKCTLHCVQKKHPLVFSFITSSQTRMWANAQRDGRPAEYRWRPLFNAAMFDWRLLL